MADIEYGINIEANSKKAEADIDALTKTVNELVKATNTLTGAFNTLNKRNDAVDAMQKAKKAAADAAKAIKDAEKNALSFSNALKALANVGIVPVVDLVGALRIAIELLKKAIVGTVGIAGQFEQWQVSFETMIGSAERARDAISSLTNFAAKTPFTIPQVMESAKQLLAVGFSTSQVIPTLKNLGDVAAGLSVPIERLILNFGQVKTQTYLTGRELRDFTIAGVPLVAQLAKQLGVSEKAIKDMVEQGAIGFKQVEQAFRDMASEGGRFYNLMDKQNKTLLGKWSEFKDQMIKLGYELGIGLATALKPVITVLGRVAESIAKTLKNMREQGNIVVTFQALRKGDITEEEAVENLGLVPIDKLEKYFKSLKKMTTTVKAPSDTEPVRVSLRPGAWKERDMVQEELKRRQGMHGSEVLPQKDEVLAEFDKLLANQVEEGKEATTKELMAQEISAIKAFGEERLAIEADIILKYRDMAEKGSKEWVQLNTKYNNVVNDIAEKALDKKKRAEKEAVEKRQTDAKNAMDMELIEAEDNLNKQIEIYNRYIEQKQLSDTASANAKERVRKIELKREKEFYDAIGDIAKSTMTTYAEVVQGKLDLDKDAANKRKDIELDAARAVEDVYTEFNRKTFKTIDERKEAEKQLAEDLQDIEKRKARAIRDQEDKTRMLQEDNAAALKKVYKKMVIDYLAIEAAKSAAWFASQTAMAVAAAFKNPAAWGQVAVLVAEGLVSQAAFATAISTVQGLATGGIVAGEGIYRMGEGNKKEAVIPLESGAGIQALTSALGGDNTSIRQPITLEIDGRKIAEVITNYQIAGRKQGRF